jgi:hypothetical protein
MMVPVPAAPPKPKASDDEFDFGALADMEGSAQVDANAPMALAALPPPPASTSNKQVPPLPGMGMMPGRPVAPKTRTQRFRFAAGINRGVITLAVVGIALLYYGIREYNVSAHASKKPQLLSCKELGQDGPGDNKFVSLIKYGLSPGGFVHRGPVGGDHWDCVFVPAFPLDGDYAKQHALSILLGGNPAKLPPPDPIHVIIKSTRVHAASDLKLLRLESSLEGLVVNDIDPLTPKEIALLQPVYPKTDFTKCWILEEGREPASAIKYLLCLTGGGICLLLAVAMTLLEM